MSVSAHAQGDRPLLSSSLLGGAKNTLWSSSPFSVKLILLGFVSLAFQWVSELIKRIAIMKGELVDEHDHAGHHSAEAEAERLIAELADTTTTKGGEPPGDGIR